MHCEKEEQLEKPVRRHRGTGRSDRSLGEVVGRCQGVHGAGRDFAGLNWQGPGMDWVRVEERLKGVGRNPQEGGDLRLQYCPELGSVPVDNMFVV